MSLALLAILLVFLVIIRMPIAFAMGFVGTLGIALEIGVRPAFSVLERTLFDSTSSFILVAIPLFILMAELLTAGDVTRRAIVACQAWIGHIRGGLAMATIGASVILAALVGSSTASAAAMASAAFPEMKRHKYSDKLATAVVSVGGTLAVLVPPSIILVVYGVMTETSIGRLFIAGIIPGLFTASGLIVVVAIIANRTDQAPKGDPFVLKNALKKSGHIWPITALIILVIGAIYGGIASPSEAAALGVLGALLLGLGQRTLKLASMSNAVSASIRATVMIIAIIACSAIFSNYLVFTQVTPAILTAVNESALPPYVIMLSIVFVMLIMGMLMDQLAILSLTMPLAFPAIISMGYDPVWFGIVVTKTVEIGLLTPPLGLNAYVVAAQTRVELNSVFRGLLPFIIVELIILGMLLAFPQISLVLPNLMY